MTGTVTGYDGAKWTLPPLLAWEIGRTDGAPCGSFRVQFAAEQGMAEKLRRGMRFSAFENGAVVFSGVVDEAEITLDSQGLTAELTGRDLSALLLDNETRAAEFQSAQLRDILARYVTPWGINLVDADALPPVEGFSVGTGESCWRVLDGFCRHAAGVQPRFLADGTLRLRRESGGKLLELNTEKALELRFTARRYGVISSQTVVDLSRKTVQTVPNVKFLAQMGQCEKVITRSGWTMQPGWRTAQQRIDDSCREAAMLRLALPGSFLAEPGDRLRVNDGRLGLAGTFTVTSAATRLDGGGLTTELTAREGL